MYETSLHGTIYKVAQNPNRAPRCGTGTHNINFGIISDSRGNAVDKSGKPLSKEEQEKIRQQMVEGVCFQCHIKSLTRERLDLAKLKK